MSADDTLILEDAPDRLRALKDFESTLLVEAGAGTGKTSLLAARVTLLLASGAPPDEIAAITFTEAAASELAERVGAYVAQLRGGVTPAPLKAALPHGPSDAQRAALSAAASRLDALTTATIHGFCQILLAGYAVEADIDPGAQVVDEDTARLLFDRVFEGWLQERLSRPASDDDPIALLTRQDPRGVVDLLRTLARFRRRHRSATAPAPDLAARPDLDLAEAVRALKAWRAAAPEEPFVSRVVAELEVFTAVFADCLAAGPEGGAPTFADLWRLAHPERSPRLRRDSLELERLRTAKLWRDAAGAEEGARLEAEFQRHFEAVDRAYRNLLASVAGCVTAQLSRELDEVLAAYEAHKRAAAVLDFDDLLERASLLLRRRPEVRRALSTRFRRLLVDEFQDTDPVQCDIIFRLGGTQDAERWEDVPQRPGSLFLVGDPKQSLFLFRGAEIRSYEAAKAVVERAFPGHVLHVTSNFRTIEEILTYVNRCFEGPLSQPGQPGYVPLGATRKAKRHGLPCAARISLPLHHEARADEVRDAEAAAVAEACARMVGGLELAADSGEVRKVRPGEIALLAPAGTDLWRYERALQQRGLPYASKAGRGFFRRQEVQDLVALTRTLADADDTLAFGALMRGPLVGLTDETLLDITAALPRDAGAPLPRFSILTPPEHVADEGVRETLTILRNLRRRIRFTTPSQLLLEAVERLKVRAILTRREPRRASAANANVDLFLQRASAYGVRGLRRFTQDLTAAWAEGERASEGRVDAEGEAIDIVSIHSAKGLEWPIVIAINMASRPPPRDQVVHRSEDDTLHWTVGGVASPGLQAALAAEAEDQARERARLLYVGCTRARDLLIIPRTPNPNPAAYAQAVDLAFDSLPELDLTGIQGAAQPPDRGAANLQDRDRFLAETGRIAEVSRPIQWLRPSAHDDDQLAFEEIVDEDAWESGEAPQPLGGGRLRGLLLHKLVEEILGEGLAEDLDALTARARMLLDDLRGLAAPDEVLPDPAETARTVRDALALPDVAALRPFLKPEVEVFALLGEGEAAAPLGGRADAIAVEEGRVTAVLDWKSDVDPTETQRQDHADQLRLYLAATGAPRGALVYASLGWVRWVEPPPGWRGSAGDAG